MDSVPSALGTWLLPALGAGFLSLFVVLGRFAVASIIRKIEDLTTEVRHLSSLAQAHETRLALGNQSFGELRDRVKKQEEEIATLRARFHDLVNRTAPVWGATKKGDNP